MRIQKRGEGCCDGGQTPDFCCGGGFTRGYRQPSGRVVMGDAFMDGGGFPPMYGPGARSYSRGRTRVLAGLGYSEQEMKLPYCGTLAANSTQICRSDESSFGTTFGQNRGTKVAGSTGASGSAWADLLGGAARIFAGGMVGAQQAGIMNAQQQLMMQQQQAQSAKTMQMVLIGGIALVGVIMLTRKQD